MMKPSLITISFLIIALSCPLATWGQESATATRYNLLSKQYDEVSGFEWSLDPNVVVEKNGKKGVVNAANKLIIPLIYDEIECLDDLFIVCQNGLMGVVDENNKLVIPVEYSEIRPCPDKDGLHFMVAKFPSGSSTEASTALMGLMDDCGNVKIPLAHVNMEMVPIIESTTDVDGRIITAGFDDFKHGLLDFDGRVILPQEYDVIANIATDWRLLVTKDGRYGIVDWQGNTIMPLDYNDMVFDDYYSSGLPQEESRVARNQNMLFGISTANNSPTRFLTMSPATVLICLMLLLASGTSSRQVFMKGRPPLPKWETRVMTIISSGDIWTHMERLS